MDLHRSFGPVSITTPQMQGTFFGLLGAGLQTEDGKSRLTIHVVPQENGPQHSSADFLRHLGFSPAAPCAYWAGNTQAHCLDIHDDADLPALPHVLDNAFGHFIDAMAELEPCGMSLQFEAKGRFGLGLPHESGGAGDGHSGADVHVLESREDDWFEYAMNEVRHPDSWLWALHVRPKGPISALANSGQGLEFLGFKQRAHCATFKGDACYYRALFHRSGTEINKLAESQQWLNAHPAHFPHVFQHLYSADGILEQFGLHLFPEPPKPTLEQEALADPQRTFCFLDTDVLIHGRLFTMVNWPSLLKAKRATIVFAATVLDELDRLKDGSGRNDRRRHRGSAIPKLLDGYGSLIYEAPGARFRENCSALVLIDEPDIAGRQGFDPNLRDDRLHAEFIDFAPRAQNVALLSFDNGMRLKANGRLRRIGHVASNAKVLSAEALGLRD